MTIKEKINKIELIKIKTPIHQKATVSEKQTTERRAIQHI